MLNRVTGKGGTVWKYQQRPRQEELSDGERSPASEEVVFTIALSMDLTLVADSPTVKSTHHFPTGTGVLLPALMLGTANPPSDESKQHKYQAALAGEILLYNAGQPARALPPRT